jgi:hypothetical protein
MTLEPRMLAAEERLQRLASGMPSPDVEAGWAALSAQLEPPLASVIPLRRRRFGRPLALAAAAALLVAGSALAAITRAGADRGAAPPVVASEGGVWSGSRLHAPFSGPQARTTSTDGKRGAPPAGQAPDAPAGGRSAPSGEGNKAQDDPNDRDQGTGNDGRHDDNGGGNDGAEGSPRGHGHGGAEGSSPPGHGHAEPSGPSQAPTDPGHHGSDQSHGKAGGNGNGHGH